MPSQYSLSWPDGFLYSQRAREIGGKQLLLRNFTHKIHTGRGCEKAFSYGWSGEVLGLNKVGID
jgi:hypothetical protein